MANPIVNPAVPNLPLATEAYDRSAADRYSNVLRLFFNQINSVLGKLISFETTSTTVYKVATLPKASTAGAGTTTFVSDATVTTFATIVVGGGTNTVPVYSDGTNWRVG